jgi:hypothetical protein
MAKQMPFIYSDCWAQQKLYVGVALLSDRYCLLFSLVSCLGLLAQRESLRGLQQAIMALVRDPWLQELSCFWRDAFVG